MQGVITIFRGQTNAMEYVNTLRLPYQTKGMLNKIYIGPLPIGEAKALYEMMTNDKIFVMKNWLD